LLKGLYWNVSLLMSVSYLVGKTKRTYVVDEFIGAGFA
jgi:hypothetical protein